MCESCCKAGAADYLLPGPKNKPGAHMATPKTLKERVMKTSTVRKTKKSVGVAESPQEGPTSDLSCAAEDRFLDQELAKLTDYAQTIAENSHTLRLELVRVYDSYRKKCGTAKGENRKRLSPEQSKRFADRCWTGLGITRTKVNRLIRSGRLVLELGSELEGACAEAFRAAAARLDDSALDELQKLRKQDRNRSRGCNGE
jgi:hypothetical protein